MDNTTVAVITALISGLFATIITLVVTSLQAIKKEKRDYKMQIFKELFAFRTDILSDALTSGRFQAAINQVFVAYNGCPKVMAAFETFRKNVIYKSPDGRDNEKIVDDLVLLIKAMADELKVDYSFSNDDLFTKPIRIGAPVISVISKPPVSK